MTESQAKDGVLIATAALMILIFAKIGTVMKSLAIDGVIFAKQAHMIQISVERKIQLTLLQVVMQLMLETMEPSFFKSVPV